MTPRSTSAPLRIVYSHRTFGDGAEGIHIREIVEALRELGHEVTIVAPLAGNEITAAGAPPAPGAAGLSRFRQLLPAFSFRLAEIGYNAATYSATRAALRSVRPAFVYERYAAFNFGSLLAAQHAGVPTILEVNTPYAVAERGFTRLYFRGTARRIERWVFGHAAGIVTVSQSLRHILLGMGLPESKIAVTPNAINPSRFKFDGDPGLVRDSLGLTGQVVVGFVGSMRRWHGIELLAEVIPDIVRTEPRCSFLIVGEGELLAEFQERVRAAGCGDRVVFTGRVAHDEVPRYVAAIDIGLMPSSNHYGSPMKIFEYMAFGKATVAPRLGPLEDVISSGVNGLLVQPDDPPALASAIVTLVRDRSLRERLGLRGQRTVLERHTWRRNAERILDMYADLSMAAWSRA